MIQQQEVARQQGGPQGHYLPPPWATGGRGDGYHDLLAYGQDNDDCKNLNNEDSNYLANWDQEQNDNNGEDDNDNDNDEHLFL